MRIVVVSGHYPPNFISGGSIVPQRLARSLRARGHTVSVYAGRMDETDVPLRAWDEVDDEGMSVRWIVTTPFEPWREETNFDNPAVHEDFVQFLAEARPEIVHLHDLQMLGGSLVRAAADSGARVLVTMHDFWWICARLFLVDRNLRPCPIVPSVGACKCEVNAGWRMQRTARLADELAHADVVLAPSVSAARVLIANGVAPGRVAVDENGLPDVDAVRSSPGPPRPEERTGPVRFIYAGGQHELKGATIALRAAYHLQQLGVSGWELTTYGIETDHPDNVGLDLDDVPIRLALAFGPEERSAVFQCADVLVLPSIMLETHSILVREALVAGLPVVCTNTLGPEEVVRHGHNGLIVPAGDHEALAMGMARLVQEPELLGHVTAGAAAPVAIRSLTSQVEALEARYAGLLDRSDTPAEVSAAVERRAIRFVVFACGIESAPLRYRARLAAEAIAPLGVRSEVRHYRDPSLVRLVEDADALYVYRVPATGQFLDVIAIARRRGIPVIFDVDDLIFDPSIAKEIPALQILSPAEADGWLYGVHRYRTTMEHCDGFVGSTRMLADHAASVTALPVAVYENGVGRILARASAAGRRRPRRSGPLRVGYLSGTITHDRDWFWVEPAIVEILDRHPEVELWLAGLLPQSDALARFGSRVKRIPLTPWLKLPVVLRDIDVNIAPLEPGSRFNEAKSAIKWLEAALVDTPTVASSSEPFRNAIDDGVSGFVVEELTDWVAALDQLLSDPLLRQLMGQRAHREALLRWSPELQGRRFLSILAEAKSWPARARVRPVGGWEDAIADEPFEPVSLEPYTASRLRPLIARRQAWALQIDWLSVRLRRHVEEEGVRATAQRMPRAGASKLRAAGRTLVAGRPVSRVRELATYTRRLLDEVGPRAVVRRAGRFAVRTLVRLVLGLPGLRHGIALEARLRRALTTHGVGGSVELAVPVVRHQLVHGTNLVRVRLDRLRASVSARARRLRRQIARP